MLSEQTDWFNVNDALITGRTQDSMGKRKMEQPQGILWALYHVYFIPIFFLNIPRMYNFVNEDKTKTENG